MASTRPRYTHWKTLRTGLTDLADDDWADDASDALPSHGIQVPFNTDQSYGKVVAIEFAVLGYVAATGLTSDNDADTFSCQATYLIDPPGGSSIVGRTAAGEQLAIAQVDTAGFRYFRAYRIPCHGADTLALRLHTDTGLPGAADRLEVLYREVLE